MNKKYLNYIVQKEKYFFILLFIIYLISFPTIILFIDNDSKVLLSQVIYVPSIIYIVIGYLLPIWDFRQNYFKNMANLYYALPIKTPTIYKTKTYFHLLINVVVFSIPILLGILILYLKQINLFYGYLLLYLLLIDILFICLFLFQSFIASRCYNIFEACCLTLAYLALPAIVLASLYFALDLDDNNLNWSQISFIGAFDHIIRHFLSRTYNDFGVTFDNFLELSLTAIICLFLHFLTLHRVNRLKIENVGEKTDSIFSTKLLVPIYTFFILLLGNYTIGYLSLVINLFVIIVAISISLLRFKKIKINLYVVLTYLVFLGVTNLIAFFVV